MSGWIKLHRDIKNHWLYTEKRKFSKFEAWNDILLNVNFAPAKTIIKGKFIEVNRGESIMSLDSWAERWRWNKSSVKRFLELLKKDSMITLKNETVTTRLTVCKYEYYQGERNANETSVKRKRNANETQTKPIEEEEENKEEKKEINISFESFWDLYDKKVGSRKKCEKKWLNLTDEERQKVIDTLPMFKKGIREKQYQPNPETYFNQERWNDELTPGNLTGNGKTKTGMVL